MEKGSLGLLGLGILLLFIAISFGTSEIESADVKTAVVLGCLIGAILSLIAFAKTI